MRTLRFGSRGSRLALAQSGQVADALRARGVEIEIVVIRTSGDRLVDVALADFGGKALFVKEIEEALLDGRVDAGVHSLKDMPAELPAGLCLPAYPPREDSRVRAAASKSCRRAPASPRRVSGDAHCF
jgi:hydroxymethylbilane synthase